VSEERPRRGWTVYTEEIPAQILLDMPPDLAKMTVNFLVALALEAGGAVDLDRQPPGDPMDDLGVRYSLQVVDEPVILEYVIHREMREIRVPSLVWYG
jgi:hypothetical protein